MATRINFIDIYVLHDDVDAGIIESILADYDISCIIKEFDMATDTLESKVSSEKRISVEEEKAESARQLIADAIDSGLISDTGTFKN